MKIKYIYIFQFSIVFLFASFMNYMNIKSIKKSNPQNIEMNAESLVYNEAIYSIDNYWYLNQIKNYMNGKGFTCDSSNKLYAVRRTPLYPLFYGIHYVIFGEKGSFAAIKISQMMLFAFSAILIFCAVVNFTNNKRIAWWVYFFYGFNLPFISYLSFTLTESVSPSLVCILLFYLSKCKLESGFKNWFLTGLFFFVAVLTRPTIVFFLPVIACCLVFYNRYLIKRIVSGGWAFFVGASLLFTPWIIHNYIKTNGDIVVLEKYYGDQMDYGMPNMYLKYWIACWINPADYSSERISNYSVANIKNKEVVSKSHFIDSLISTIPVNVFKGNTKDEIRYAYGILYDFYKAKETGADLNTFKRLDSMSIDCFVKMKQRYISRAPFQYYVVTPLLVFKSLVFQSNSATLIYLKDYDKNTFLFLIKTTLYLFNIVCCFSFFFILPFYRKYKDLIWITGLFSSSTFFLIYFINKNFETRYIFPFLPCLFITLSILIVETQTAIRKRLNF